METWQIISAIGILTGIFGFTHFRISQVRQESIDIADRNTNHVKEILTDSQRDANQVADFLRSDFVSRAADLKAAQEMLRRESREDMKTIQDNNDKFREEVRRRLDEILREIRANGRPESK